MSVLPLLLLLVLYVLKRAVIGIIRIKMGSYWYYTYQNGQLLVIYVLKRQLLVLYVLKWAVVGNIRINKVLKREVIGIIRIKKGSYW